MKNIIEKLKNSILKILEFDGSEIIDNHFNLIEKCLGEGNLKSFSFNIIRMEFLLNKIDKLKKERFSEYEKLRDDLYAQKDNDSFYGFRFEMDIAHSLLLKKIKFHKTEHPDFKVFEGNKKMFIECTSVRSRGGNKSIDNLKKKVIDSIQVKEAKPYANNETILAIDITNLFYNVKPENWQTFYNELMEHVEKYSNHNKYGSILMFLAVFSQRTNHIKSTFCRIDSKKINKELANFVEKYFPNNKESIKVPAIPRES